MNTMFSNFDLMYYYVQIFSFTFIFLIFSFIFKFTSFQILFKNFFGFLEEFFLSLKNLSFSKFLCSHFMFILFFILSLNFLSVFSYSFPLSSQVSVVLFFSLSIWLAFMSFSFFFNMKGFLSHFVPEGSPFYLVFFLFFIEIVSSIIRPVTLTVRLVANILAGHLLMILLSVLVYKFFFLSPLYFLLNFVEILVAFIQSYIFSTMICLYFSEV